MASISRTLKLVACSILECAHFIILVCNTCVHYTMEDACQNYINQLTSLSTFSHLQLGFSLRILQSPPLIYALSLVHYIPCTIPIIKKTIQSLAIGSLLSIWCSTFQHQFWYSYYNWNSTYLFHRSALGKNSAHCSLLHHPIKRH
jgi:hypothetical protein